ncbi:MAG: BON domain-containing protein [Dehalococcoidales bacterium]|nr:BON domain-containing protein [Dehalococcoidales bacterium]
MKTDAELKQDVMEELKWEADVKAETLGVAVQDGIVTLTGNVDTYAQKVAAERAAERVYGVKGIAEEIKVKLPNSFMRDDEDIARAAANALEWNASVPDERVKVKVQDGWVTLGGDVDFRYQKDAAYDAVSGLMGVAGVTNLINLKPSPRPAPTDIRGKIESAFQRHALLDARRVAVQISDGKVTLEGTVHSYAEKKAAELAACSAPGICEVENNISITP